MILWELNQDHRANRPDPLLQAIKQTLQGQQLSFGFTEADKIQRIQFEQDRKHMSARLSEIDGEIETQPRDIEGLYQVMLRRLEPVGLVYLWPSTR